MTKNSLLINYGKEVQNLHQWFAFKGRGAHFPGSACNNDSTFFLHSGMYFCYSKYKFLKDSGTSKDFELKFTLNLDTYTQSKDTWLGIGKQTAVLSFLAIITISLQVCKYCYQQCSHCWILSRKRDVENRNCNITLFPSFLLCLSSTL